MDCGDPPGHPGASPWLVLVAVGETVTLAGLLVNLLLTTHDSDLAAAVGPIHGAFYVAGLLLTWTGPFPRLVKLAALVPVLGAWLAVVLARRDGEPRTQTPSPVRVSDERSG